MIDAGFGQLQLVLAITRRSPCFVALGAEVAELRHELHAERGARHALEATVRDLQQQLTVRYDRLLGRSSCS